MRPARRQKKALDEGIRRSLIRADRADQIRHNQVGIGMNACEVKAAFGMPTDIYRTSTADGATEQWVYGPGLEAQYVYLTDGLVTAVQD